MPIMMFAAIDVGSYELAMKIFEFSKKNGMKEIDHIRHRIDLGTDTYATGKVSYARMDELCRVLREFSEIMKSYKVDHYKVYGTSAIRETENTNIILDQIKIRTGIKIEILSNSEQRFLDYKSIASKGEGFNRIIEKGTAIVDIGGGSIQLSLFDKDSLITTQNLRLGILRIREKLTKIAPVRSQIEDLIEEMALSQLMTFKKLFIKDREIKNIIIVDDYVSAVLQRKGSLTKEKGFITSVEYLKFFDILKTKNIEEMAIYLGIPAENAQLLYISAMLIKQMLRIMDVELIWAPGVTLCDGIAYEYGEKNRLITHPHNFEQDIIACAKNISKRYMGSKKRGETLEKISITVFDSMKKIHGLGKRDKLYLQLAAILHDCGKYITLSTVASSSYSIIMATEIIGLSHQEREIVANVVKYNHIEFEYYEEVSKTSPMDKQSYLIIAKLTAILRVANALDKSHKQKFSNFKTVLKDDLLTILVETNDDITLEKGLFQEKADFFEEVYSIRPVIKQKKINQI